MYDRKHNTDLLFDHRDIWSIHKISLAFQSFVSPFVAQCQSQLSKRGHLYILQYAKKYSSNKTVQRQGIMTLSIFQ